MSKTPGIRIISAEYIFEAGDVLPEHQHDERSLHDILVKSGEVVVAKASGDVIAKAGTRVALAVGERHSITAVTPSVTIHTLVNG